MKSAVTRTIDPLPDHKPHIRKKINLTRACSFSHKSRLPDSSPGSNSSKKPVKSFSTSNIQRKSTVAAATFSSHLPSLHLEALRLPKTHLPKARKTFTIKKRFVDMSTTLDRIPSTDWLSSLLYSKPEFPLALERNLAKCRSRLAKSKIVREAIREEDGDASERSFLQETAYF